MKQITAIVQPHRLERIEQALHGLAHLPGFTVFPAHGHPRGQGPHHAFAPTEWNPDAHDRLILLMFCPDELAQQVVEAYFGIPAAGGVMHTLHLRLAPDEIGRIAHHAPARILALSHIPLAPYPPISRPRRPPAGCHVHGCRAPGAGA